MGAIFFFFVKKKKKDGCDFTDDESYICSCLMSTYAWLVTNGIVWFLMGWACSLKSMTAQLVINGLKILPFPCQLMVGGIYVGLGRYITVLAFLACSFFCSKMLKHNKFHKLVELSGCDLCNITFIRTTIDITFIVDQSNLPPLQLWKMLRNLFFFL